jgi:hypothetical protein
MGAQRSPGAALEDLGSPEKDDRIGPPIGVGLSSLPVVWTRRYRGATGTVGLAALFCRDSKPGPAGPKAGSGAVAAKPPPLKPYSQEVSAR